MTEDSAGSSRLSGGSIGDGDSACSRETDQHKNQEIGRDRDGCDELEDANGAHRGCQQHTAGGVSKGQPRSGSGGTGTLTGLDGSNREGSVKAPSTHHVRGSPYVRESKAMLVRVICRSLGMRHCLVVLFRSLAHNTQPALYFFESLPAPSQASSGGGPCLQHLRTGSSAPSGVTRGMWESQTQLCSEEGVAAMRQPAQEESSKRPVSGAFE